MQLKRVNVERCAYLGALVCTVLISTCLATVSRRQIINSYPLAINFDGFMPTPSSFRSIPSASFQQASIRSNVGQQNPYFQSNGGAVSGQRYHKRSEIGGSTIQQLQSTQINPPESRAAWSESGTSYQKRNLNSESTQNSDYNGESSERNERVEPQKTANSTISLDSQRLLLIRQKMIDSQGHTNVSIEDTNWKIAASCLSSKFGSQFIRNKDVKCASSQVVLSISRMQRAGCKLCEPYFHCEGFSNAIKRCRDNYDVEDTLNVIRECQGLTIGDAESIEATKAPIQGVDCQTKYLCGRNCNYNPSDGTCPRNNCFRAKTSEKSSQYKSFVTDRRGRLTNVAYPAGSPLKNRTTGRKSNQQ